MGFIDSENRPTVAPTVMKIGIQPRPSRRVVSEFETEIRQLYMRTIEEPIPTRMIEVLRAGLIGSKS